MKNRTIRFILSLTILLVSIFGFSTVSHGASLERITSFDSDITVHKDATMTVTETIRVISAGIEINHGIYRDFPTKYKDRLGNKVNVGFHIVSVRRDGSKEPYHIESMSNGKRVYIGDKDVVLPPGAYVYQITYKTDWQIGFFKDFDELYWNVTGNGWIFPIDKATATVRLPGGIRKDQIKLSGYTGLYGSGGKDLNAGFDSSGNPRFAVTRALDSSEGLTIVVEMPKGYITEPSMWDRIFRFISNNSGLIFAFAGVLLLFAYYIFTWYKVGRDPAKGTIIPLYTPPEGFSPAAIRYILKMGYDNRTFTSAMISLAVKGVLRIEESKKSFGKKFVLYKNNAEDIDMTPDEREVAGYLPYILELKNTNYQVIQLMMKMLKEKLSSCYEKVYFKTNGKSLAVGILSSFIIIVLSILMGGITPLIVVPSLLFLVMIIAFQVLLKAPTIEGRKLMDQIEGFRMFLSVTEQERLNLLTPPERTPQLFEKYLPYALALGVENQWAEQFTEVFARISKVDPYAPSWYYGSSWDAFRVSYFASSLGSSFSSAISASSSPPGSSSGGGGGSSGGGGGGGGGGGW